MASASFFLYFDAPEQAQTAAERLGADGYAVETRPSSDEEHWLTLAEKDIGDEGLERFEEQMERIAAELGGEYDGHEVDVP